MPKSARLFECVRCPFDPWFFLQGASLIWDLFLPCLTSPCLLFTQNIPPILYSPLCRLLCLQDSNHCKSPKVRTLRQPKKHRSHSRTLRSEVRLVTGHPSWPGVDLPPHAPSDSPAQPPFPLRRTPCDCFTSAGWNDVTFPSVQDLLNSIFLAHPLPGLRNINGKRQKVKW